MATEKHYEMLWDCQFCGTKKNLGKTHQFCPNCGSPQQPDARYFPPDNEKIAVEDHEYAGADVICPACSSTNSAKSIHCGTCGSPLESAEKARSIKSGEWMEKGVAKAYAQSRDVAGEKFEREMEAAGVTQDDKGGRSIPLVAVLVVVGIVIVGAFMFFSRTEEAGVVVSGHEWRRTIMVERYETVNEGDWQNSVPAGAYNRTCYERQNGTERVPDGEECRTERRDNGDGTFSEREVCEQTFREEPVYDTWCDYDIDTWVDGEDVVTSGGLSDAPSWGTISSECSSPRLGCQRETDRREVYTVLFDDDNNTYRCNFPQGEWADINIESQWSVEVRMVGGAVCDTLEPR